jgi:cytidylate kinase
MQITFSQFTESFDTVHPHKQISNEYDEVRDIARDENDQPLGITRRKLTHQFEDPHSGDVIHVTHDIEHHVDDYNPDPKKAPRTTMEVAFTRSPGQGSSEQTYGRVKGGKGALAIFGTVAAITKSVAAKHGKGETTVYAEAENSRVSAYSRMISRHTGKEPQVTKYPDSHPGAGNSKISFAINEMYSVTVGEHPESGDHIYAPAESNKDKRTLAQVTSSTLTFNSKFPPGAPGSLVSDHEHGPSHMNKLKGITEDSEETSAEKTLHIMRGISGSGKSTVARELAKSHEDSVVLSTDRFFMTPKGRYKFDPSKIAENHAKNIKNTHAHMEANRQNIFIDNTNLVHSHMTPYVAAAKKNGYSVKFHDIHGNDPENIDVGEASRRMTNRAETSVPGSDHGEQVARRQKESYEPFKTDDPIKEIMKSHKA